jgi:single-strand selective monofunctional uracil DNA glycosylase
MDLLQAADELSRALAPLRFGPPVTHVYNPLEYARAPYAAYVEAYGAPPKRVVFLGMNPGPWGMAQTGVPFGDPTLVREWLKIQAPVARPREEHPKRPVLGLDCPRQEISGTRLWGAVRDHFGEPQRFFDEFFMENYCPLCFMEDSGRNRTPDHLAKPEREALYAACDAHLRRVVQVLRPTHLVGVGAFAAARAAVALEGTGVQIGQILHPSPSSPAANTGWLKKVKAEIRALGICRGE